MQESPKALTTENSEQDGGVLILPQDDVTLYATKSAQFYEEGQEFTAHSALAKKLIKAGKATDKKAGKKTE